MKRIVSTVLALAFVLSACTTPQGAVPPSGGIQPHVMGWNLHNQDPQVGEVLMNNNDVSGSRLAFQSYLANGGKADLFIGCADGRISAGSLFYSGVLANGGTPPFFFEIGSLAGQVTPVMLTEITKMVERNWIRSIVISAHTSESSLCGAQSVKAELDAGKSVAEFDTHGVGEAAGWIQSGVDSSIPTEQVAGQVDKVFSGTGMEVPVFGCVVNHATQTCDIVAEVYPGLDPNETAIRDELVNLNRQSAAILGPQAQAEGLATAQHFRHIIITQGEIPFPAEFLAGLSEGGLDQVFNASILVSPFATEEQIVAALAPAKAALQYSLAHATSETEVLFYFQDQKLLLRFLKEIEPWQVYQDFLANTQFQEVTAFTVDATGTITGSLLVKPAYTGVSPAMSLGPTFRSDYVSRVVDFNGRKWAVIHGGDPNTENSVMVTVDAPGVYRFARVFAKYADAQFFLNGNLAGEPELDGLLSIAKFGANGGIVYTPDFGEDLFAYLSRTGNWHLLPEYIRQIEEMLLMKCDLGFCSTDVYHVDQFRIDANGRLHMVDWSPVTTITGATMLARFGGSPAGYQLFVQRDLADMVRRQANLAENMGWNQPIRQYLPLQWSQPASSSFYSTGSQTTIAAEQAAAFERVLVNLGSTSPETVMEARNWLTANGAVQVDGQWVIFGQRSMLASGPIRFANLSTYYPDGAKAFVGFQTPRGVFGFERAENVLGGMGGWRVYAPSLNQVGVKLNQLGPMIGKVAVVVWAGFVAGDIVEFSEQTEYMMTTSAQMLQPPTSPSAYMWFPNEKTPYVVSRWELPLAELQSGCNGTGLTSDSCGNFLPEGQRSPIALIGALAGEHLPQTSWPSFGLDGNNVLLSWEYMREGSTVTIWHNGQMVDPGSSLDYYESVMTQDGLWLVPYHAELNTATCTGLCITQVHGGEELLFQDNAQPRQLDLCPLDYATSTDACLWRP